MKLNREFRSARIRAWTIFREIPYDPSLPAESG